MKRALKMEAASVVTVDDLRRNRTLRPGLSGDVTGLSGNVSDLSGNVDDCDLSAEERKVGVDVVDLVQAEEAGKGTR